MPAKCFGCGAAGYVQSECPYCADVTDRRPAWCTICDQRTRLVTVDLERGTVKKCPSCHPSPMKQSVQHRRCPSCKAITYSWDDTECGKHREVGKQLEYIELGSNS